MSMRLPRPSGDVVRRSDGSLYACGIPPKRLLQSRKALVFRRGGGRALLPILSDNPLRQSCRCFGMGQNGGINLV